MNQKTEKQIELKAAERLGGDALLDGAANDSIERAVRLQVELRQIDLAITRCRAKRLAAVQEKLDAEVADLRQRAAEARQQAEAITAKTTPLSPRSERSRVSITRRRGRRTARTPPAWRVSSSARPQRWSGAVSGATANFTWTMFDPPPIS